jgi:thioredoxin reductase
MSSVPGIFAAGDVCGDLAQLAVSVGGGAVAATSAFEYLKKARG